MGEQHGLQAVELHVAERPLVDVPGEDGLAITFGRRAKAGAAGGWDAA